MENLETKIVLAFRNAVWKIRYFIKGREHSRCPFYCGIYELKGFDTKSFEDAYQRFLGAMCEYVRYEMKKNVEVDCVLQYEERGQLGSVHIFIDKKYQYHFRFYERKRFSEKSRTLFEIDVTAHKEIRPDYDPIAHVKGKELEGACEFWNQLYRNL